MRFNWHLLVLLLLFHLLLVVSHLLLIKLLLTILVNELLLVVRHLIILIILALVVRIILVANTEFATLACKNALALPLIASFLYLFLVLLVLNPVGVQCLFLEHSLLIKKSLGEGVIFPFNPFGFSFSNSHVQTSWTLDSHGQISNDGFFWNWCYRAPFATADLYKLVE